MRISDWSSDVCSSDLLHARRQPPEKFVESREGGVGIGGLGEGFQEAWHQLRQQLPRPFAAHRAVPAVMPVADHAGYGPDVAESHSGQSLHSVGMVLAAGEDKRDGAAEVGTILEGIGVVILD